jgi:hypothetical protein
MSTATTAPDQVPAKRPNFYRWFGRNGKALYSAITALLPMPILLILVRFSRFSKSAADWILGHIGETEASVHFFQAAVAFGCFILCRCKYKPEQEQQKPEMACHDGRMKKFDLIFEKAKTKEWRGERDSNY